MAVWDVPEEEGMDPTITGFWYAFVFGRSRFNRLLEGLSPEQLVFKPAGFNNSIAALVVHVVAAEINFAHRIQGKEIPAELKAEFLMDQPQSPLPQPAGETVESLIAKLQRAEAMIKEALTTLTEDDLDRELNPGGQPYTMRWLLSLVTYHATNHFGQLQLIKQQLSRA
ncbi:MAG TPA: DinB family protein [Symbiobacteriaceae bacterium]|nr:DinB family protein [Symbiobacteriaceae bacterium]